MVVTLEFRKIGLRKPVTPSTAASNSESHTERASLYTHFPQDEVLMEMSTEKNVEKT